MSLSLLALAGCGDDDDAPQRVETVSEAPAKPAKPALCSALRERIAGRVDIQGATELSGLVASRSQAGVLWTHNDSGDGPRIFAISPAGRRLAEVSIGGARAVDWEDIAARGRFLYIADIGDNAAERDGIVVYKVPEPRLEGRSSPTSATATALPLRYPDGAQDAEALLVDPADGRLVVVTKSLDGRATIYEARPGGGTLRRIGTQELGLGQMITAGDVSGDGRTIVLRSYDRAYVWTRKPGERVARALLRAPCQSKGRLREGQAEALALTADGRGFTTVSEGSNAPVRSYRPR